MVELRQEDDSVRGWKGEEGHKKEKEAVKAEVEAERSESGNLGEKSVQRRQAGLEQGKNGGGDRRQLKKAAGRGQKKASWLSWAALCWQVINHVCAHVHMTHVCGGPRC